jgi:hypothetical protein
MKKALSVLATTLMALVGVQPGLSNERMTNATDAPNPAIYSISDFRFDGLSYFNGTRYVDNGSIRFKFAIPKTLQCDNFAEGETTRNCTVHVRSSVDTTLSLDSSTDYLRTWDGDFILYLKKSSGEDLGSVGGRAVMKKLEPVGTRWTEHKITFRSEGSQTVSVRLGQGSSGKLADNVATFQVTAQSKADAERNAAAKEEAQTAPLRPSAQPEVFQRTLGAFAGDVVGLSPTQKAQVEAAVLANPDAEKFICTGIRFATQPMSVNIMVRKRAKAACDYAKQLNPNLSTWFQNKPTQARSYAGKVLLTVKTPAVSTNGVKKSSWPWISVAVDPSEDAGSTSVDLDILESRVRMDTNRGLSFYVDFSETQNLGRLAAANSELKFSFDTNGDQQEDFYISSASFLTEGVLDGALKETGSGLPVANCPVSMQLLNNVIYTRFNASCFSTATSLNFKIQTQALGAQVDAAPDVDWYTTSIRLSDVFVCSKDQKGKHFTENGVRSFCMLTSGTVANGKWGILPESRVTDVNYLKMYACASGQKGNVVTIDRSSGVTKYVCAQLDGKWKYLTEAQAKAAQDKAAAAAKAAADRAAAAERARKVASARYSTHKAYFACNLDNSNKKIWVEVADGGRTLIMSSVGRYSFTQLGVQYEDYVCVANYLKMPRSLQSKVGNTRALDGTLDGKWGSLSAFWNYHPDSGMNITFTLVN